MTIFENNRNNNEFEALRAAVIVRHRVEWEELEEYIKMAHVAMKAAHTSKTTDAWEIAGMVAETVKSSVEALAIMQDAERKSWGLNVL